MPYRHLLVVCDASVESDDAVRAASRLAMQDHAQLTVVAVAEVERPGVRCGFGTSTWNDVLRDAAAADLDRARGVVASPAHFAVLCGAWSRAVATAASDLGCDAIMVGHSQRRLRRIGRKRLDALHRDAGCAVLQPQ